MSPQEQAVCVGMDALRISIGVTPRNFQLHDVIRWLRIVAVHNDSCPECGGELDTGYECTSCGFDGLEVVKE